MVLILAVMHLLVFLRGVLRNTRLWRWFFDGENVVICMVYVVKKTCDFRSKKIRHEFQFYFWSDQHSRTETNELVA